MSIAQQTDGRGRRHIGEGRGRGYRGTLQYTASVSRARVTLCSHSSVRRSGTQRGMPVLSVARQRGSNSRLGTVTKGTPLRAVLSNPRNVSPGEV
eukprot:365459-Chlamydomonas_euryale.AAC.2